MSISSQRRLALHNHLGWMLVFILAVIPVFLGGNRPMAWALAAVLTAATGLFYSLRLLVIDARPRAGPGDIPILTALYWLMAAWMVVQILPLGLTVAFPPEFPEALRPATISLTPSETLFALLRWLTSGLVFFFALVISRHGPRMLTLLKAITFVVALHAGYGLLALVEFGDTLLFVEKWAYRGSATGTFVNRNSFATFLSVGAVTALSLTLRAASEQRVTHYPARLSDFLTVRRGVFLPGAALLLILATLVATSSRMGFFAGLCGLAVVLGLHAFRQRSAPRVQLGLGLAVVAVVVMAGLYGGQLFDRLGTTEASAGIRLALYRQVWDMVTMRPLTGYGGGSFALAFPLFHAAPVSFDLVWDKAHSTYLGLWADYGLIFGSIPLLIFIGVTWRIVATIRRSGPADPMMVAALGALATVAIHSLVDFSMEIQGVTLLVVALLGSATARTLAGKVP